MKRLLSILFLLIVITSCGDDKVVCEPSSQISIIDDYNSQDDNRDAKEYENLCLSSPRGVNFSGEETSIAPSFRSISSTKRSHSSNRTTFKIYKSGKLIDKNIYVTFLESFSDNPSGLLRLDRYLYSLCTLII